MGPDRVIPGRFAPLERGSIDPSDARHSPETLES